MSCCVLPLPLTPKRKIIAVHRKWQLRTWLLVYCTVLPVNLFTICMHTLCILFHHMKANNVFDLHQNKNIHTISLSHVPSCDDVLFPMFPLMMMMSIFNLNIMFLSRSDELFAICKQSDCSLDPQPQHHVPVKVKWVMTFFISTRMWTFIPFLFPMFSLMMMMLSSFTTTTNIMFTKTLFTRCWYQWSLFRSSTLTSCSYQ